MSQKEVKPHLNYQMDQLCTCPRVWLFSDVDGLHCSALASKAISGRYELVSDSDERSAVKF